MEGQNKVGEGIIDEILFENCHCLMLIFHFGCITNDLNKTKEKNNG